MVKKLKQLAIILLLFTAVLTGFFLSNQNKAMAFKQDGTCYWVDQGHINCKYATWIGGAIGGLRDLLDKVKISPSEVPIIGPDSKFDPTTWDEKALGAVKGSCFIGSDCDGYYYAPAESASAGYPIFYSGGDKTSHAKYLHFVSGNPLFGYLSNSAGKIAPIPNKDDDKWIVIAKIDEATKFGGKEKCGIKNPGSCKIQDDGDYNGAGLDTESFVQTVENIQALNELKKACEKEAPLGFILCPVFEGVVSAISSLIGGQGVTGERDGLLISFLTFSPLDLEGKDPEKDNNVLQQIVGNVVSIANAFYVIIFLLLIFASSLPIGVDNYTIKKTLPRFIAAVIMTQFAFVICGVIIDFFNLLGTLVPNMIFALPLGADIEVGGVSAVSSGLQKTIGAAAFSGGALIFLVTIGWLLIIIVALIALVAIITGFVYMVIRYLVLFILVLIAPLAFASWVLPGTQKFFGTWWRNFIILNAMFPMITGLLAVSIVLSRVLLATDETNAALKLVALFIPIVALFLIPKTLKWSTKAMSSLAGLALGAAAGKMPGGGNALGKKTATKAVNKGKEIAKASAADLRNRKAADYFGKGEDRKATLLMGKLPNRKGMVKAREGATKAEQERAAINQAALSAKGISLQGLDLRGGMAGLKRQLMDRGMNDSQATKIATDMLGARNAIGVDAYNAAYNKAIVNGSSDAEARNIATAAMNSTLNDIKDGNDLYGLELGKVASGKGSSLLGVKAGDQDMQVSAVSELAKNGGFDKIHAALDSGALTKDVMMKGIQSSFSDVMAKAPDLVKGAEGAFDSISAEKFLQLDKETAKRMIKHVAGTDADSPVRKNLLNLVETINQDPKLKAALDPKTREAINGAGLTLSSPPLPPGTAGPVPLPTNIEFS